jgi:hypothetical protein
MKLSDLIPIFESVETKKLGQLINASKKAYASLPDEAKRAVREWETANWDEGKLSDAYRNKNELLKTINDAFAPVKQKMHQLFGDTITLHRGQRTLAPKGEVRDFTGDFNEDKVLFSFSFDENVARDFAHGRHRYNIPSDDEIKRAVAQYNKTGYVQFGGKHYKRLKDYPNYFGIYDRYRRYITDGDNLEELLMGYKGQNERNKEEAESKGSVKTVEVPIDKILWITNNLGSKEFIVALNPLTT